MDTRGVHGPNFPGPAHSHYGPARPVKVICKARPVQACSLAGPAGPIGTVVGHHAAALNAGDERKDDVLVIIQFFKNDNEILPQQVFRSIIRFFISIFYSSRATFLT